jgi:hypothetical protein
LNVRFAFKDSLSEQASIVTCQPFTKASNSLNVTFVVCEICKKILGSKKTLRDHFQSFHEKAK